MRLYRLSSFLTVISRDFIYVSVSILAVSVLLRMHLHL